MNEWWCSEHQLNISPKQQPLLPPRARAQARKYENVVARALQSVVVLSSGFGTSSGGRRRLEATSCTSAAPLLGPLGLLDLHHQQPPPVVVVIPKGGGGIPPPPSSASWGSWTCSILRHMTTYNALGQKTRHCTLHVHSVCQCTQPTQAIVWRQTLALSLVVTITLAVTLTFALVHQHLDPAYVVSLIV